MAELGICPFCGGEMEEVASLISSVFFSCTNKQCSAVVSFDRLAANEDKVFARALFNNRAEGSAYHAGYKDGLAVGKCEKNLNEQMFVVIKTGLKELPEYCDECIYYECKPHPIKGWSEHCGLFYESLDEDDCKEGWHYDGDTRPAKCPLVKAAFE